MSAATKAKTLSLSLSKKLLWVGALAGFGGYFGIPFHILQLGSILTPLFIPIGIACSLVDLPIAILVGILIPLLSALQTGMPSFTPPFVWLVVVEAALYGAIISLCRVQLQWSRPSSVIAGILAGKLALFIYVFLAGHPAPMLHYGTAMARHASGTLWNLNPPWHSVTSGLPGSLLALLVVPVIVKLIENHSDHDKMAAA
jgi:phage shock protein PspC (stress-responsive transcriptional regulator)